MAVAELKRRPTVTFTVKMDTLLALAKVPENESSPVSPHSTTPDASMAVRPVNLL